MSVRLNLVCVVPVYNEAVVLEKAITMLVSALRKQLPYSNWRVVIASNGSTDETDEIGRQLERVLAPHVQLLICSQKGRGRALSEVLECVSARRYLYIDVDLPCRLNDLVRVLAPLDEGIDLVTSRRTGSRPRKRRVMTFGLRQFNRWVFGVTVSDSQCGVKALSPEAARVLVRDCQQNGWYLDTELVVLIGVRGLRRSEVPIHWVEKRFPSRASKIDVWVDSLRAFRSLAQILRHRRELG